MAKLEECVGRCEVLPAVASGRVGVLGDADEADEIRAVSPTYSGSNKHDNKYVSQKLGQLPSMHARLEWLHAHLHVPLGYMLNLIPVNSGCTVTNIDHECIIHADHRMSASRPINWAKCSR